MTNKLDLSPLCLRARNLFSENRVDDALGIYDDILKIDPDCATARADRGTIYAMMKQFDFALSDLQLALNLGYVDESIYNTMATIYLEKNQLQQSLFYFSKAIELNSDSLLSYYNRSSTHYALGEKTAAIIDLEKCLTLNPDEATKKLINEKIAFLKK